jgi:8-oxo-dGTP diphosphatase
VDVLVFTTEKTALKILLVRRSGMPFQGRWSLPGTFIRMEETAEQAAERALSDKTGAERIFLEQLYTFTALDRDPRMRIISVAYMAMVPACRLFFKAGSDKGQAMLFDVVRGREEGILLVSGDISLLLSDLAFDHGKILETALERMAGKIEYTDIGYEFLEDKDRFTLSELRNIYDAVTGKTYDIGNFRRFIKNRYIVPGKIVNNHE